MNQEAVKKQRLQLMNDLAALYSKHGKMGLDNHEPMTDKLCAICEQLTAKSKEIERLEKQIKPAHEHRIRLKQRSPEKQASRLYNGLSLFDIKTVDNERYLVRSRSAKQVKQLLSAFNMEAVSIEAIEINQYPEIYLETATNTFTNLENWLRERPYFSGVIAEFLPLETVAEKPQRVLFRDYHRIIRYTISNFNAITNFVAPCQVTKAKKKNKLNILTPDGSIGLAPEEYLLKVTNNRYVKLTVEELNQYFKLEIDKGWHLSAQNDRA